MGRLLTAERDRYDELFLSVDAYRDHSPGAGYARVFAEMTGAPPGSLVVDAGCATGKGGLALHELGYLVHLVDLTSTGLVDEARGLPFTEGALQLGLPSCDYVFCTDVLEHLPPEWTMLALARMLEAARSRVFCSIALQPDAFGVWVGAPLHQTVMDYQWWRDHCRELATVVEARDLLGIGLYCLESR